MPGSNKPSETGEVLQKDSLLLDGFRRLKDHSAALLLPRMIMTQHLFTSLGRSRKRLADSHRYQMNLLGEKVDDEDDGNIHMQGDTTITNNYQGASWLRPLTAAAVIAVGYALWQYWPSRDAALSEPTAVEEPCAGDVQDWKLGVTVSDHP